MAFVLSFNLALQVLAAFLIFLSGYIAIFTSLLLCLVIAKGIYEGAKGIRAYAVESVSANSSVLSDVDMAAHRSESFVIPLKAKTSCI